jgi:hypothetical protein
MPSCHAQLMLYNTAPSMLIPRTYGVCVPVCLRACAPACPTPAPSHTRAPARPRKGFARKKRQKGKEREKSKDMHINRPHARMEARAHQLTSGVYEHIALLIRAGRDEREVNRGAIYKFADCQGIAIAVLADIYRRYISTHISGSVCSV